MQPNDDILDRYAKREQSRSIPAPPGFADRVMNAVAVDRRVQTRKRWLVRGSGLALAASVLIAVAIFWKPANNNIAIVPKTQPTIAKPNLGEEFSKVGDAVVSLSQKTTDQTLQPTKTLLSTAEAVPTPKFVNVDTPALPDVVGFASEAIEPVTSQPKKAVNLFLRDFGIAPRK